MGAPSTWPGLYNTKPPVSLADQQAINAGFKSAADQEANRMMRNQLEMKAAQLGVSNQDAYKLVEGPLTSTAALQDAWNKLQAPAPAAPVQTPAPTTPTETPAPVAPVTPTAPSQSDIMAKQLSDSITAMQSGFQDQLKAQASQFAQMQQAQEERMAGLQQMLIQSQAQAQQQDRPTVAGVKTATGTSGDAMQIARRGVSGAFGRRGMRISSLNV